MSDVPLRRGVVSLSACVVINMSARALALRLDM